MILDQLPNEILSLALHHVLWGDASGSSLALDRTKDVSSLCAARLVSRRWNALAEPILYRTLALRHNPGDDDFSKWNAALDNERIRQLVHRVAIHSAPDELHVDRDDEVWEEWGEEGTWPAFTDSIDRIKELDALESVGIFFSYHCAGAQADDGWEEDNELNETRVNTLKAVFNAIQDRAEEQEGTVSSLTLVNLQNMPTPDFTDSDVFQDVTKDIIRLHISVAEEFNEHGPDGDLEFVERRTFEPYLGRHWIAPMADHLRELTLYFNERWGTAPGYFNLRGTDFPQLEALHLGNFVISHHDHLDWVFAQKTLTSLCLNSCYIATHLRFCQGQETTWEVQTHDWKELPHGSYGFIMERDVAFTFDGAWETFFDRIRTELTGLTDFRFDHVERDWDHGLQAPVGCKLGCTRYIVLDTGLAPSPWIEADERTGEMSFGNNQEAVWQRGEGDSHLSHYRKLCKLNMSEWHQDGDSRAFKELLQQVNGRQSRGR